MHVDTKKGWSKRDRMVEENYIADKYLQKLKDAGLHISRPIPCYNYGNRVYKPKDVKGNSFPENIHGPFPREMDAPDLVLFREGNLWIVNHHTGVPHMVPGDFVTYWSSIEEAMEDVLDYFFGNPRRMQNEIKRYIE